jgi:hypothetical protein
LKHINRHHSESTAHDVDHRQSTSAQAAAAAVRTTPTNLTHHSLKAATTQQRSRSLAATHSAAGGAYHSRPPGGIRHDDTGDSPSELHSELFNPPEGQLAVSTASWLFTGSSRLSSSDINSQGSHAAQQPVHAALPLPAEQQTQQKAHLRVSEAVLHCFNEAMAGAASCSTSLSKSTSCSCHATVSAACSVIGPVTADVHPVGPAAGLKAPEPGSSNSRSSVSYRRVDAAEDSMVGDPTQSGERHIDSPVALQTACMPRYL